VRRLYASAAAAEADVRPTLLGVVTLMFLLLFFLLATSSGQRLGTVDLRLGGTADLAPLPHAGLVQAVAVAVHDGAVSIDVDVRTTDIAASASTLERRRLDLAPRTGGGVDLAALVAALDGIKAIDRSQERATVIPDDATDIATLFGILDAVRGPAVAPLFPRVALQ